ncbi:unnamed protein product [Symbiodinium natans]|uniref:Uncharacterized protein n=1 Tax=Symbiodinium natans TaxID=878477 RepID=A0A812S8V8_9DINO|nr:unnamed protein product [Symbiodinium natans]
MAHLLATSKANPWRKVSPTLWWLPVVYLAYRCSQTLSATFAVSLASCEELRQKVVWGRGGEAQLRAAEGGGDALKLWNPGPAKLKSPAAKRALKNLQYDPLLVLFDDTVKEEFRILAALKQQQEQAESRSAGPPGAVSEAFGLASLRRRILQVKSQELFRTAAELLYLMVASMFKYLEVPLIPPLQGGGLVKLDMSGEQLKGLTEIYSMEALEMVRDHLFKIVDVQAQPQGPNAPTLRIALYQASQVYAMSALFGYFLRQADIRYQLDKLVSLGSKEVPPEEDQPEGRRGRKKHRRPVPRWMELQWVQSGTQSEVSLKDYIERFGPAELRQIRTVASAEARYTLEIQIGALFGNLRELKSRLMKAVEGARNDEEATERLQKAVMSGKIQSISVSYDSLRRLILEAVSFGSALFDAETEVSGVYSLTPTAERPGASFDDL